MNHAPRLNATSLEAELNDSGESRTVSRRRRKMVGWPEEVLDKPRLSAEEVEAEVGESEEWDEASFEETD